MERPPVHGVHNVSRKSVGVPTVGCDTMLFVSEQHAVSIFRVPDVSEYYVPNVTFNKTNLNFPAVRTTTIG